MKTPWQWLLVFGLFGVLAIGVRQYRPGWAADQEFDLGKSLKALQQIGADLRIHADLENQDKEILRRIEVKSRLALDLIEERRTLRDVARLLREENAVSSVILDYTRARYPGRSEEEVMCRHMIQYVGGGFLTHPSHAKIVTARLEAELQADLQQGNLPFSP